MKRLLVDMDDVLADATGQFLNFYEKEFGVRISREALNHKDELEGFPDNHEALRSFVFRKDFFRTMAVNENSQEVMRRLNERYEVFIVSSAMEFPNSLSEKFEWLNEHFPFLHWKQFVFCGHKSVVHGDFMIDDLPHNLEAFKGEKLLFSAPHNLQFNHFKRVNDWKEVERMFLG
ncbi:MAG: 5'(3')-deoxyribonucleotidase [Bacteroidetes bacterium]|nr:5'(3')-deoxyribonucleotidase [Bacteroidota bacterium]MBI3483262.1 5'(3')-deoxyribonucleotidase [Bacteroidota bacterium]